MRLGIKIHDRFGNNGTDTLNRNQVLPGFIAFVGTVTFLRRNGFQSSFFKRGIRQIGPRETLGIHLTHMTDAKAKQKAMQGNLPPVIDRIVKLLHGSRAKAFDVLQLLDRARRSLLQRKNIRRRFDLQAVIFGMEEELDLLFAKTFNIQRIARHEMANALDGLRRAGQTAGATIDRLALLPHRMAVTDRAFMRKLERRGIGPTLLQHNIDNLGNNIACALHDDRIADADIMLIRADTLALEADALDIVLIVQRGIGDNHTADSDRLQSRNRGHCAGASHLNVDFQKLCKRLFSGKLVRDSPTRAARAETEPRLQVQPVDLVDDAVNIIVELRSLKTDGAVMRNEFVRAVKPLCQRIDRETP